MNKRIRIFIICALLLLGALIGLQYKGTPISERSFILGAGLDRAAAGYALTCEILKPAAKAGGGSAEEDGRSIVRGEGADAAECVKDIFKKTAKLPSFGHCNLLVLGESMRGEDLNAALEFFIKSPAFNDAAVLCFYGGDAEELIKTTTPLDKYSSLAVGGITAAYGKKTGAEALTLARFRREYLSKSAVSHMTLIKLTNEEKPFYDCEGACIVKNGVYAGTLSPEAALGLKLLDKKDKLPELEVAGKNYDISGQKVKLNVEIIGDILSVVYEISVKIKPPAAEESDLPALSSPALPQEIKEQTAARLESYARALFSEIKTLNADILSFADLAYAKYGTKWQHNPAYLFDMKYEVKVTVG